MTLPELLIAVTLMAMLATVLSSAVIVVLRQDSDTRARVNVAQSEQSVALWLPADLSSADRVVTTNLDADPPITPDQLTPCPGVDGPCPGVDLTGGSYGLLISWRELTHADGDSKTYRYTNVSYYYSPTGDGTFKLDRVECTGPAASGTNWTCSSHTAVRGIASPPEGWNPGDPVPTEVMLVTVPLAPDAIDDSAPLSGATTNAKRVIVTIDGGDGIGNSISITAGGTERAELPAISMVGAPAATAAISRCGGPIVLLVDESTSIGNTNIVTVRNSVRSFAQALVGTPVRLQIVTFSSRSRSLGTTEWTRYYDLSKDADVTALLGSNPNGSSGGVIDQISIGGGGTTGSTSGAYTNWEDGMFRATRQQNGDSLLILPKTVVFFTDGVPTRDRTNPASGGQTFRTDTQNPLVPADDTTMPAYTGSTFSQEAWDRAQYWANQVRGSTRLVGVMVGDATAQQSTQYYMASTWTQSTVTTRQARYWTRSSSSSNTWNPVTKAVYDGTANAALKANWFVRDNSSSPWKPMYVSGTGNPSGYGSSNRAKVAQATTAQWPPVTTAAHIATFDANDDPASTQDGWLRTDTIVSAPEPSATWVAISEAQYNAGNVNSGDSDGYKKVDMPNKELFGLFVGGSGFDLVDQKNLAAYPDTEGYPTDADVYVSPSFNDIKPALRAIAVGECGGSLTLQTKLGANNVTQPFVYQNVAQYKTDGVTEITGIPRETVTTNVETTTGVFQFKMESPRWIDVRPYNTDSIAGFSYNGWSCRRGAMPLDESDVQIVPVAGSPWPTLRVKVTANDAVSCTLQVTG